MVLGSIKPAWMLLVSLAVESSKLQNGFSFKSLLIVHIVWLFLDGMTLETWKTASVTEQTDWTSQYIRDTSSIRSIAPIYAIINNGTQPYIADKRDSSLASHCWAATEVENHHLNCVYYHYHFWGLGKCKYFNRDGMVDEITVMEVRQGREEAGGNIVIVAEFVRGLQTSTFASCSLQALMKACSCGSPVI